MTDAELLEDIEAQKALMMAVATGGPRIESVNGEYIQSRQRIATELAQRRIDDPNPYTDLWRWYGKWSSGDLPTYRSRRTYIGELYAPLIERLQRGGVAVGSDLFEAPTGWTKVDRQIDGIRTALESARTEEDYQGVGHRCREAIISLAQAVYRPGVHRSPDGTDPSTSDAKRMIEAYLVTEQSGDGNKAARQLVRAAFDLANRVQHDRAATFVDAALCAEGAITAVNTIAILSGRRDEGRRETAVAAAIRRAQEDERRQRRDAWLQTPEAASAAIEAFHQVTESWKSKIATMNGAGGFACGPGRGTGEFVIRSSRASLAAAWRSPYQNDTKQGRLSITDFDGWLPSPGLHDTELDNVARGETFRYAFEMGDDGVARWRDVERQDTAFTSEQLAEHHLRRLVDHGRDG
jgi:hypothetical protein